MLIAERTLEVFDGADTHPVRITVQKPQLTKYGDWTCEYEIGWPEGPRKFAGHGIDNVQALMIALQMIGAELYTSTYHRAGQLRHNGQPGGYGFPVTSNCRHLLVGDDRDL
jgi:hypothetical protein